MTGAGSMDNASIIVLVNGARILTYDDLTDCFRKTEPLEIMGLELVQELIVSKDILTDHITRQSCGENMPRDGYDKCARRLTIPKNHIAFIRRNS